MWLKFVRLPFRVRVTESTVRVCDGVAVALRERESELLVVLVSDWRTVFDADTLLTDAVSGSVGEWVGDCVSVPVGEPVGVSDAVPVGVPVAVADGDAVCDGVSTLLADGVGGGVMVLDKDSDGDTELLEVDERDVVVLPDGVGGGVSVTDSDAVASSVQERDCVLRVTETVGVSGSEKDCVRLGPVRDGVSDTVAESDTVLDARSVSDRETVKTVLVEERVSDATSDGDRVTFDETVPLSDSVPRAVSVAVTVWKCVCVSVIDLGAVSLIVVVLETLRDTDGDSTLVSVSVIALVCVSVVEFVGTMDSEWVMVSCRVSVRTDDGVKPDSLSVTVSVPVVVAERLPWSRVKLSVTDPPLFVTVTLRDRSSVRLSVVVLVRLKLILIDRTSAVKERVMVSDGSMVRECVGERVPLEWEIDGLSDGVMLAVGSTLGEKEAEVDGDSVLESEDVAEGEAVCVAEPDDVCDAETVGEGDVVPVADGESVRDNEPVCDADPEGVKVTEWECRRVLDALRLRVNVSLSLTCCERDSVAVGERESVPDILFVADGVGETVPDVLMVFDCELVRDADTDTLAVAEGVPLADAVCEAVADDVPLPETLPVGVCVSD